MNDFPGYGAAHEETMRMFARTLDEDHRRRYAAIEALKIGFGGIAYVARVLGMSRRTIYTGIRELEQLREDDPDHPQRPSGDAKRVRRPGGGRPPITERKPQLESTLHEVLETHSAGSPTDERCAGPISNRCSWPIACSSAGSRSVATRPPRCWIGPAFAAVRCARS
jgi:hypothetical protein